MEERALMSPAHLGRKRGLEGGLHRKSLYCSHGTALKRLAWEPLGHTGVLVALSSRWDRRSPGQSPNTALGPQEPQGEPRAGIWCVSCGHVLPKCLQ